MNPGSSNTCHRLLLNLLDKKTLKKNYKYVALPNHLL